MTYTYASYRNLLRQLKTCGYTPAMFRNCRTVPRPAIIRHDIDLSPRKALLLAQLEAEEQVGST